MALADYRPEHRVFSLKGGSFTVKGISLTEFTTLIRHHMPDLEAIFDLGSQVLAGKTELTEDDVTQLAIAFAEQAPALAANVIALASGEEGEKAVSGARALPFPVQVDVIVAIVGLTFDEVGGVKKALGSIAGLLTSTKAEELKKVLAAVQ